MYHCHERTSRVWVMTALVAALAAITVLMVGCGGSSAKPQLTTTVTTGGTAFRIDWPARGTAVPVAANSLEFVVGDGKAVPPQMLDRPAAGGTSTVTFTDLPAGDIAYTITAFPQTGEGGTPIGVASGKVTITPGQSMPVTVASVMTSTINSIAIVSAVNLNVAVGSTLQLLATATDASTPPNVLFISTKNMTWASSAPDVASVEPNGKVSGLKVGTTNITVTEAESGKTSTVAVTVGAGVQATYVGRAACRTCHGTIDAEFTAPDPITTEGHGQDFTTAHGSNLITGSGGACAACHTTGFGDTTHGGYDPANPNPLMGGIGCEDCHGPGSNHIKAPTTANINRHPVAENTCWNCHVDSFKTLTTPIVPVTDSSSSLYTKAPNAVYAHHPQALFLQGRRGYNDTMDRPGIHAVLVDNTCVTCHIQPKFSPNGTGKIDHSWTMLQVDFEACTPCHGAGGGQAKLDAIESELTAKEIELGGVDTANPGSPDEFCTKSGLLFDYAKLHNIDVTTNLAKDDPFVKTYKAAAWDYRFVIVDKSNGVHNPSFARKLLSDAKALLANNP